MYGFNKRKTKQKSEQLKIKNMSTYRIDWTKIGSEYTDGEDQRECMLGAVAAIDEMDTGPGEWDRWHEIPKGGKLTLAMMPGMGIQESIKQLRLPNVSHVAISAACSPFGLYGMRAHYKGGQVVEVFVIDSGDSITPVFCRVWEVEKVQVAA